ncbi:ferritin-like domain-containing protein [Halobaculum sp. MBLA0143]|uniref:ferritin-like domain-containing protein n=1 Tax=Halobaculum sp. MBLA0143 TaxID=3079933 RepID=UPI003523A256
MSQEFETETTTRAETAGGDERETTAAETEVISLLQRAYLGELSTVVDYQTNAVVLDGLLAQEVVESLQADVTEELEHARLIAERLSELGARPPSSAEFTAGPESLRPPEDSTDVASVVRGVLDDEEAAIETYRDLVAAARDADDPVTEDLAVRLLGEEESHREEFSGFAREFDES